MEPQYFLENNTWNSFGRKLFFFFFTLLFIPVSLVVYGINTGFGKFARVVIAPDKLK